MLADNRGWVHTDLQRMKQRAYSLDPPRKTAVLEAIQEVSKHRGWNLLAAHIRTNHLHVVVEADVRPEKVMSDFKSYASRRLNCLALDERERLRWTRHGST